MTDMAIAILSADTLRRDLARERQRYTIVDARPRDDFLRGHIPGALSLEWEQWCGVPPRGADPVLSQPGYWGTLVEAAPAWYADRLSRRGVTTRRPIVVYADGVRSKGREGRIAWMLLYLGAPTVLLLDGGWTGWLERGGATSTNEDAGAAEGTEPVEAWRFVVSVRERRRWTHARMARAYRDDRLPVLVDTRTPPEFAGDCYDYLPRKGRLPDAVLFPFSSLFDGPQRYVGREKYLARLPSVPRQGRASGAGGANAGQGLVTYCEVGVRASLTALLHEIYTGEVVGVFDGSLIEWALHADLPVDGPVPRRRDV